MDNRSFNEDLGQKLKTAGDVPKSNAKNVRLLGGAAIALLAATVFLTADLWIGT